MMIEDVNHTKIKETPALKDIKSDMFFSSPEHLNFDIFLRVFKNFFQNQETEELETIAEDLEEIRTKLHNTLTDENKLMVCILC